MNLSGFETRKYCSPFIASRPRKCIQEGRDNMTRIIEFVRPTTRTHLKSREVTGPGIELPQLMKRALTPVSDM